MSDAMTSLTSSTTSSAPPWAGQFGERSWQRLLRDLRKHKVVPVIGPELVTVPDRNGNEVPLYQELAAHLADRLGLDIAKKLDPPSLNDVACAHLLASGTAADLYYELVDLVENRTKELEPLPAALLDLASIKDFRLYIATTFDPLLERALQQTRPEFIPCANCGEFRPTIACDLPETEKRPSPYLYYILGNYNGCPDFVVWEEDYVEYLHSLVERRDNLKNLFSELQNVSLLLIGSPFNDWIVRLFLRVAKDKRFSEKRDRGQVDYLADHPERVGKPSIFFIEKGVGTTRIIPGCPRVFAAELARRWRADSEEATTGDIFKLMDKESPKDAFFISYARTDLEAATTFARGLMAAQVPVWMDRARLKCGDDYECSLEHAVKEASFFVSLISATTEAEMNHYVHKERAWAAQRYPDGYIYYIPVLIDVDVSEVKLEPAVFNRIQWERLPDGKVTPEFAERIQKLFEEYRSSGRPRGPWRPRR